MKDNKGKDNTIGKRIAQLRNACGLTQEELASDLYISRPGLSNYENNRRTPDVNMLHKLCDKFDVSMNYLLGKKTQDDEACSLDKTKADIQQYLTKDGHLDLSSAPSLVKIFIVQLYLFLMQRFNE